MNKKNWGGKFNTGKYVEAYSWHASIDKFLQYEIKEAPLLHVCSGPVSRLGNIRVDRYVNGIPPAVRADWTMLPFKDDSFAALFADPPWAGNNMKACGDFCKEAIRVANVFYLMSPWLWCSRVARRTKIWVREFSGINQPILIVRYERSDRQLKFLEPQYQSGANAP
jgi:hypothetical protein